MDDYIELNETITFRTSSESCIEINTLSDGLLEINETFVVELSSNDPAISFTGRSAEITIVDTSGTE